jgi:hypothetical protein
VLFGYKAIFFESGLLENSLSLDFNDNHDLSLNSEGARPKNEPTFKAL